MVAVGTALLVLVRAGSTAAQELITPAELMAVPVSAPDAVIPYGPDPLQFGHLRLPDTPPPHEVAVLIHGGCYLSMYDIRHAAPLEAGLAEAGYAVWSIEYRRVGDDGGGWPGTFLDVAAGIDFLRALDGRKLDDDRTVSLDLDRVYVVGHSAGANMAIWAAARPRVSPSSEVHTADPFAVRGVLGLAPAATLATFHETSVCGGVIDALMGGSPAQVPERYDAVSPMRLMPEGVPQVLVVGALDRSWGPAGLAYHQAALADGGSPVALIDAPESGHFEMIAPWSSTWPLVLEALERLSGR